MNNLDTEQPIKRRESMSGLAHLIGPAIVVAVASIFLYIFLRGANQIYFEVFFGGVLLCSAMATAFAASVWAVFGLGSYFKRLCWSHLVCAIVGLGHLVGFIISNGDHISDWQFLEPIKYFLLGIVPVSLAAQIPMGFFRVVLGLSLIHI